MNVNFLEELFLEGADDQIRQARNIIKQKHKDYSDEQVEELLQKLLSLTEPYQDKSVPRNKPATNQAHLPKLTKFHIRGNINLNALQDYYNRYMSFPVLSNKSIERFQDFRAFENEVERISKADKNAKTEKIDEPPIYSDNKIDVFLGNSMDKCIKYGQGETYGLCISRVIRSKNFYTHYRIQDKLTTYFVYFKNSTPNVPTGFIIVDATENPEIFSYNIITPNSDMKISKNNLLEKFPDLKDAMSKNIFAEIPLTSEEIERENFVERFAENQDFSEFIDAPEDFKILALKSVIRLADDIYIYLEENNYWNLINEFVSSGPNLTPHQAESIEKKGGSLLKYYIKKRDVFILDVIENHSHSSYYPNKLDENVPAFQMAIKKIHDSVDEQVKNAKTPDDIDIVIERSAAHFLFELPKNMPKKVRNLRIAFSPLTSLLGAPEIVNGNFYCGFNNKLTSLNGAPESVGGNFSCNDNKLTSLNGAPKSVGGNFDCNSNELTSLKGAPENINGSFDCSFNNKLTSLNGAPESVNGDFSCNSNKLTSLNGAPKSVGRDFNCISNKLTSLEGAPESVGGSFNCRDNNLTSLKGAPESVGGSFECSNNNLTSLEGAPEIVNGNFYCSFNKLTSLIGAPESVDGDFFCNNNDLTSLEGAPKNVNGSFDCSGNLYLMSLKGSPLIIGGSFFLYITPKLSSLEGIAEKIEGSVHTDNEFFTRERIQKAMEESKKTNRLKSESFKFFYYNQ